MPHLIKLIVPTGVMVWINFLNIDPLIPIKNATISYDDELNPTIGKFEIRGLNNITATSILGTLSKFSIEINIPTTDTNVTFSIGANQDRIASIQVDNDAAELIPFINGGLPNFTDASNVIRVNVKKK